MVYYIGYFPVARDCYFNGKGFFGIAFSTDEISFRKGFAQLLPSARAFPQRCLDQGHGSRTIRF
jgi:hypothetical protein